MIDPMTNAVLILSGIAVIAGVVVLLDWYSRRKDDQSARGTH
jgi:hypothetical protein